MKSRSTYWLLLIELAAIILFICWLLFKDDVSDIADEFKSDPLNTVIGLVFAITVTVLIRWAIRRMRYGKK